MEEQKEKKNLLDWCKEHPKTVFWSRFVLWTIFAAVLPFCFIAWRYGIFTKKPMIQLTGWGVIGIIIAIVFIITLIKYLYKGLKPGLAKQCVNGFFAIILPLVILLLLVTGIESNIKLFKQALCCVILCELVGIPLNPFPAWLEKRKKEQGMEQLESMSDVFWNKFFRGKEEHKDGE